MSCLTVDIGNTLIKITRFDIPGEPCRVVRSLPEVVSFCESEGCSKVAFCTTSRLSPALRSLVEKKGWWELTAVRKLPIGIRYGNPTTLGADRVAAAVGAKTMFPEQCVLIADAGTALTTDVVDAAGNFVGGNISPGLEMRFRALHDFTSQLPLVKDFDGSGYFGSDTVSAIGCGVVWGLVSEIAGAFAAANREFGARTIVVTGGDAERLRPMLQKVLSDGVEVNFVPDLVSYGLKIAYEYNHE